MDFGWDDEHQHFRAEVRDFIERQRTPALVAELQDLEHPEGGRGRGPEGLKFRQALNEAGYTTMAWPTEYGGQGRGAFYIFILNEELAYHGLPFDNMSITSIGSTIMHFASEEQKRDWLPKVQSGDMTFALGYTEPNAGTDLASLQTRAVRDGDEWVINGQKIYGTFGHNTHAWLSARTDPDAPKHRGISMFVIDTQTPGITVRPLVTMGDTDVAETFLEDVRVPADALIGEENRGWYMASNALDLERVVLGPYSPLMSQYDEIVDYLKEERPNLVENPVTRTRIAESKMDVEIARALSTTNATIINQGQMPTKEASMVKVWVSEARYRMSSWGIDLFGGFGGLQKASGDYAVAGGAFEGEYRSHVPFRIGGGTNDIQRRIIATRGLGLPRG